MAGKVTRRTWTSRGPTGRRVKHLTFGYTITEGGKRVRKYDAAWTREDGEKALASTSWGSSRPGRRPPPRSPSPRPSRATWSRRRGREASRTSVIDWNGSRQPSVLPHRSSPSQRARSPSTRCRRDVSSRRNQTRSTPDGEKAGRTSCWRSGAPLGHQVPPDDSWAPYPKVYSCRAPRLVSWSATEVSVVCLVRRDRRGRRGRRQRRHLPPPLLGAARFRTGACAGVGRCWSIDSSAEGTIGSRASERRRHVRCSRCAVLIFPHLVMANICQWSDVSRAYRPAALRRCLLQIAPPRPARLRVWAVGKLV